MHQQMSLKLLVPAQLHVTRTARQEQKPGRVSSSRSAASACFCVLGSWLSADCRHWNTACRSPGPRGGAGAPPAGAAMAVLLARGLQAGSSGQGGWQRRVGGGFRKGGKLGVGRS